MPHRAAHPGPLFRALTEPADRAAVDGLFARAADYVWLETGKPPDDTTTADFFTAVPPGIDPATSLHAGAFDASGCLVGICEVAFGFPEQNDAYIGLMLLAPDARDAGLGQQFFDHVAGLARSRGAGRLLCAVLEDNPRARRFWERQGLAVVSSFPPTLIGERMHIRHRMMRQL